MGVAKGKYNTIWVHTFAARLPLLAQCLPGVTYKDHSCCRWRHSISITIIANLGPPDSLGAINVGLQTPRDENGRCAGHVGTKMICIGRPPVYLIWLGAHLVRSFYYQNSMRTSTWSIMSVTDDHPPTVLTVWHAHQRLSATILRVVLEDTFLSSPLPDLLRHHSRSSAVFRLLRRQSEYLVKQATSNHE